MKPSDFFSTSVPGFLAVPFWFCYSWIFLCLAFFMPPSAAVQVGLHSNCILHLFCCVLLAASRLFLLARVCGQDQSHCLSMAGTLVHFSSACSFLFSLAFHSLTLGMRISFWYSKKSSTPCESMGLWGCWVSERKEKGERGNGSLQNQSSSIFLLVSVDPMASAHFFKTVFSCLLTHRRGRQLKFGGICDVRGTVVKYCAVDCRVIGTVLYPAGAFVSVSQMSRWGLRMLGTFPQSQAESRRAGFQIRGQSSDGTLQAHGRNLQVVPH